MKYIVEYTVGDTFIVEADDPDAAQDFTLDEAVCKYDTFIEDITIISVKEYK